MRTLTVMLGIAVLGPALLAGCSSSESSGTGAAVTAAATSAPSTASPSPGASVSATASASASASASALPTAKSSKLSGATLAASIRAGIARDRTVSTSVLVTGPLPITGQGAAEGTEKLKVAVTLAGEKKIAVVHSGKKVYLKLPGLMVPGKDWVAVPAKQSDPVAGMYATSFEGYETPSDLAATPKVLASLGTYAVAGAEKIDGVDAVKYTVATSATKAAKLLPPAYQPVNPTRMKNGTASVSVWVDASGRLLRTATTATIPSTKRVKVLIGYTGWGKPVDVAAPAASEVGKLS